MLLEGKKLLVTGVLTRESIAYSAAQSLQEQGAEIVLTSFGRAMGLTEKSAKRLPNPVDVLEMDATARVWQECPRGRIEQQGGGTEDGEDDDDAAHDQRVDAETGGEAGGDSTDPAGLAGDAEATHPLEERAAAVGCPCRGRSVIGHGPIVAGQNTVGHGGRP